MRRDLVKILLKYWPVSLTDFFFDFFPVRISNLVCNFVSFWIGIIFGVLTETWGLYGFLIENRLHKGGGGS